MSNKVNIKRLATGIPGLDELLGGGVPEFSFNLIAGAPGCGKTPWRTSLCSHWPGRTAAPFSSRCWANLR
ncbi:RAD55 family ATPase [Pseudoduganella guangdongensis]|uniref:RAD55 family ATPase n=1 Tax=Pseudoduganella guangdongensis TaxID=2692179 RepID=UPI001E38CAA0|nr:ATPase domain-containing protein [Pseudoduganella guangdongensis]